MVSHVKFHANLWGHLNHRLRETATVARTVLLTSDHGVRVTTLPLLHPKHTHTRTHNISQNDIPSASFGHKGKCPYQQVCADILWAYSCANHYGGHEKVQTRTPGSKKFGKARLNHCETKTKHCRRAHCWLLTFLSTLGMENPMHMGHFMEEVGLEKVWT